MKKRYFHQWYDKHFIRFLSGYCVVSAFAGFTNRFWLLVVTLIFICIITVASVLSARKQHKDQSQQEVSPIP